MMLGEAHRVVTEIVGEADLLAQIAEHALVEVTPHSGHTSLDLGSSPQRRQVEQ